MADTSSRQPESAERPTGLGNSDDEVEEAGYRGSEDVSDEELRSAISIQDLTMQDFITMVQIWVYLMCPPPIIGLPGAKDPSVVKPGKAGFGIASFV